MHLMFVNYEFPPVGGGAAYASLATARAFVSMGHRVDFLTTATPGKTLTEVIDGVQVHRVRAYRRGVHEASALGALSFVALAAAQRERFAAANRRLVRERFSWHSIARQYESIFEQSLKPRATKGSATERAEQPPVHEDRTRK